MVTVPDDLKSKPPSYKLVWLALECADRPLNQQEIVERTGLSKRTVVSATKALERSGHITFTPSVDDAREKRCSSRT